MPTKVDGLSRNEIWQIVYQIKKICGLENELNFPILKFAENVLPQFFRDDYSFEVVSEDEMGDKHGETFPDERIISIRGDVYQGAVNGHGRDRLTIAHEVGHLFLHNSRVVSFCQLSDDQTVPAYEDPEWQANCFAGELLASSYLIKDMTIKDIADKCQVSLDAAKIQLNSTKNKKHYRN